MSDENKNNKKDNGSNVMVFGMCIGLSIGTAIGAATKNIGLWLPIGLSVAMCLGLALGHKKTDDEGKGPNDQQ